MKLTIQKVADYLNPRINKPLPKMDNIREFQECIVKHLESPKYVGLFEKTSYYWSKRNWYIVAKDILRDWREESSLK